MSVRKWWNFCFDLSFRKFLLGFGTEQFINFKKLCFVFL